MGLFSSKPRYSRVLRVDAPDSGSLDGCIAHIEEKLPDVLGYTGTKVRMIRTGPTEMIMLVDGRDATQMETHTSMTEELRSAAVKKFGLTVTASEGSIVWAS